MVIEIIDLYYTLGIYKGIIRQKQRQAFRPVRPKLRYGEGAFRTS